MRPRPVLPALVATLGIAASALLLTAPAASADGMPALSLSKTALRPGDSITVLGSGCLPDDETDRVEAVVSLAETKETTPAPDGTWSVTTTLPSTLMGGHLTLPVHASCGHTPSGREDYPAATITVDAPSYWWQTCGPLPGNPGVTGCPGPPDLSLPPPAQRTRPTAPRTTAAPAVPAHTTPPAPPSPSPTPAPTSTIGESAPTPAAGCRDCARLAGRGTVAPGDRLHLSYAGFGPGEVVTLVLHSTPVELGTFTADAGGVMSASFAVPTTLETGPHTLTLTGALTGERVARFRLAAAARASGPRNSVAGRSAAPTLAPAVGGAGALVILAGGSVLVLRRRAARAAETTRPDHRLPSEAGAPPLKSIPSAGQERS